MPSHEGRHDGRKILTEIAVLRSDNPNDLTHVTGRALIDTGATTSALCPRIIKELGLLSYEKRRLVVATEERLVDYYFFRLGLFDGLTPNTQNLPYIFAETAGFGMRQSDSFDVLLGMDVLSQCDLSIYRNGVWRLDFG